MSADAALAVPADRLAEAVAALAARVTEPEARAQLHALSALLDGFEPEPPDQAERDRLEEALEGAIDAADERRAVDAMRRLAALDRTAVKPVDWSAASGG